MAAHPDSHLLAAFAAGELPDLEMEHVGRHVQDCPRCTDRVDDLSPDFAAVVAELGGDPPARNGLLGAGFNARELPEQFGRYRIVRKLGSGGMGIVFLAHDTQIERDVAIKVPFFDESDGPGVIDRFYREARMMATLQHPNLCPVFDVGAIDGVHYLTMAYLDGHLLSDYLKKSKLQPARQVATVVRKLALALQSAHEAGVVHRDLKPANIVVRKDNEPIVMDFGLAVHSAKSRLTDRGTLMGTPAYMSPEQVEGQQERIGPSSDIYALGVILYEMISGRLPYDGPVPAVLAKIAGNAPVEAPREINENVDPSLEAICLKAIAREIGERYESAQALAEDLARFLKGKQPKAMAALAKTAKRTADSTLDQQRRIPEISVDEQMPWSDAGVNLGDEPLIGDQERWISDEEITRQGQQQPTSSMARFFWTMLQWLVLSVALQLVADGVARMPVVSALGGAAIFFAGAVIGLSLLRASSRSQDRTVYRAKLTWSARILDVMPIVTSSLLAVFAGWTLGQPFAGLGMDAIAVRVSCGLSFSVLFPLLLLCALDSGSLIPFQSDSVWRSIRRSPATWAKFFIGSSVLVTVAILGWELRRVESVLGDFSAAAVAMATVLLLFHRMGRRLADTGS